MFSLLDKAAKIFCISFQRTGTTSVGRFFLHHDYNVARWSTSRRNSWTDKWFEGDYDNIFNSEDFRKNTVFEDDPWWCLDFYKVLYHRFPDSKFVHFKRESDKWFSSMMSHRMTPSGKTLGNTYRHSRIYRREIEFYKKFGALGYNDDKIDNLLDLNESHRNHYKEVYEIRNREIAEFFERHDSTRIISLKLEDDLKWQKIGEYFGFKVPGDFEIHANKSEK